MKKLKRKVVDNIFSRYSALMENFKGNIVYCVPKLYTKQAESRLKGARINYEILGKSEKFVAYTVPE